MSHVQQKSKCSHTRTRIRCVCGRRNTDIRALTITTHSHAFVQCTHTQPRENVLACHALLCSHNQRVVCPASRCVCVHHPLKRRVSTFSDSTCSSFTLRLCHTSPCDIGTIACMLGERWLHARASEGSNSRKQTFICVVCVILVLIDLHSSAVCFRPTWRTRAFVRCMALRLTGDGGILECQGA